MVIFCFNKCETREGKKYLEDDGVLNEVVDNTNIDKYMKCYEDKLSEQEQINLELGNLKEILAGIKAYVIIGRRIDKIIIINISIFCLLGLLSKALVPAFIMSLITSTIMKLGAYALYGPKEKNKKAVASLEEIIEQKELELLNKGQELTNQKQLINSCLDDNSYEITSEIPEATEDKPLTRILEKNKQIR